MSKQDLAAFASVCVNDEMTPDDPKIDDLMKKYDT